MPNVTLSVDDETHRMMRTHKAVNWSEVARQAFRKKGRELHMWDDLLANSKMTDEDAIQMGDEVKSSVMKRLGW